MEPSRFNFSACAVGNRVVLFGGEGVNMQSMNDTFVLDLNATNPEWQYIKHPTWREISRLAPPLPRSWHNSCTLDGTKLVVSGGCADSGVLLNDTFLHDLATIEKPVWK